MQKNSLIIFKSKPAKVIAILDKKIEIETLDSKNIKLPPKNVQLLTQSNTDFELADLQELNIPELELTWDLLQEQELTSIGELSELLFDECGVNQAYTVWLLVSRGEYFSFNDDFEILIHTPEQKTAIILERQEKLKKEQELNDFIARIKANTYLPQDEKFIKEIVNLATLNSPNCRLFKYLNMEESENSAYKLLLEIGYWNELNNPHLYRYKADLENNPATFEYNIDSDIDRVDLTDMTSYAIDDEGSNDPDDAISWDFKNNKMWVHVADPSSSIEFGSEVDIEARGRGSNLYLPENIVSMLPSKATEVLGLGLNEISPALSIGFNVDDAGNISNTEIVFSKIKVTRLSYEYADSRLSELELGDITKYAASFTNRRVLNKAVELDFPEIKISLDNDNKVCISDLPKLASRTLVRDTMLMAGVAIGDFCIKNDIIVPFSTQPEHELSIEDLESLSTPSSMVNARKKLKKGSYSTQPEKHGGLGLENYVQVTSPLRRYLDLLVHYQLRRFLHKEELIDLESVNRVIAEVDIPIKSNRQTERYSNLHWKLVYLMQNPESLVDATVIELLDKNRVVVSIDSLAMTKKLSVSQKVELDTLIQLQNSSVSLVSQEAFFKILETTN